MKRIYSLAEALLVTFLWSTSYVLIKIGLKDINPLAFAAYRYLLGSSILLLFVLCSSNISMPAITSKRVLWFFILGFTGYFIAQGLQFVGLYYLPAITVTFILNLTPIFVVILSILFLKETPSAIQIVGITLVILGVKIFFTESVLVFNERIGILITLVSGIGWAMYMILMRHYLRENHESVISLTAISMGVGALMLLGVTASSGYSTMPSLKTWGIILILSIVNTAFAFVLWNHALKYLKAYEHQYFRIQC
ncbi:EamA family transporter [Thermococcus argininiproducens]|uniref:EamA family transporter n=1 Tax=Thermococcus argininiproducens TaxID=2866384 RepID=A0A9E7M870_9EURY|nr:EamA family transporter [Thermococcus argininiproducens]USG99190.1 EamA family transporter [Thermococcus argininiproducens]